MCHAEQPPGARQETCKKTSYASHNMCGVIPTTPVAFNEEETHTHTPTHTHTHSDTHTHSLSHREGDGAGEQGK